MRKPATAPIPIASPPSVGTTELAVRSSRSPTTDGSPAERQERRKRLRPNALSVSAQTIPIPADPHVAAATHSARRQRTAFPNRRIWRRRHLSRSGPKKGPTRLYGPNITTMAAATPAAEVMDCGLKKNREASPAWNMPSPTWETSRTPRSLRKPTDFASADRSARTLTARSKRRRRLERSPSRRSFARPTRPAGGVRLLPRRGGPRRGGARAGGCGRRRPRARA